jgi:hypothetical protein
LSDAEKVVDLTNVTVEDLQKLRGRNEQKLNAITQQGGGIDEGSIFSTRFELFLELFLTREQRIQYEFAFETKMEENLDEILKQIRMAKLTQGVGQAASALTLPGRG